MTQGFQKKWDDRYSIFIICVLSFFSIVKASNLPGIYFDAINPDYVALQILNPQKYSEKWVVPYLGFPLLCQIYHGTVTMFITLIMVALTGTTSVFLSHAQNCFYGIVCCVLIYNILRKIGVRQWIASLVVIALSLSPTLTSSYRMQYYIELPGVIFTLLAAWFLLKWIDKNENNKFLLISGMFLGIAFYSYFNFLFFIPGFLLVIILTEQNNRSRSLLVWLIGFSLGMSLYVIGYLEIVLYYLEMSQLGKYLILFVTIIGFYSYLLLFYILQIKGRYVERKRYTLFFLAFGFFMSMLFLYCVIPCISGIATSLNVAGKSASILERIKLVGYYCVGVCKNTFAENLILGETVSFFPGFIMTITSIFLIIAILTIIKKKQFMKKEKSLFGILITFIMYCLLSLFFASRMQGQHFLFTIFVEYLILGLSLEIIFSNFLCTKKSISSISLRNTMVAILILMIALNCFNQSRIWLNLESIGGFGKFSESINILAETAIKNQRIGEKEIYFFPEWGLMGAFCYLTKNEIAFMTDVDANIVNQVLDEGYTVKICSWTAEDMEQYKVEVINRLDNDVRVDIIKNRSAENEIYLLTIN